MNMGDADLEEATMMDVMAECSRCSGPLSRYSTTGVCNACTTRAREAVGGKPDLGLDAMFWFREDVAAALEIWDWSAVLTGVHDATGCTQNDIAAATGLSQGTVSRLMAGRSGGRTIETALHILDGLGAPRVLAGLAPKGLTHLGVTVTSGGDGTQVATVKRREFGRTIALAGLTVAIPGMGGAAEGADVTNLERAADIAADLYALDDRFGGTSLLALSQARIDAFTAQLRNASLAPSKEALAASMAGELHAAAGWFALDARDHVASKRHLSEALYAAQEAGDEPLRLHVLNTMTMLTGATNQNGRTEAIATAALGSARDPRLLALMHLRLANTAARRKDRPVFDRHMGLAREALSREGGDDDDAWLAFFGEHEVRGIEALSLAYFGDHETTAEIIHAAMPAMPPRNRVLYALDRAGALVKAGYVDEGIGAFHESIPQLLELTSARALGDVATFATTLAPHAKSNEDAAETRAIALRIAGTRSRA